MLNRRELPHLLRHQRPKMSRPQSTSHFLSSQPTGASSAASSLQSLWPEPDKVNTGVAVGRSRKERAANLAGRLSTTPTPTLSPAFNFPPNQKAKALRDASGPMDSVKYAESWLNICLDGNNAGFKAASKVQSNACYQGLARFGICRRELAKAGIRPQHIDGLYRSMYVYSEGFLDAMHDLLSNSAHQYSLLGKVWKAFAFLYQNGMQVSN